MPVSASHRRFGSLSLAAEKGHTPVLQRQLLRVLHSKHAQATSPPCRQATLAGRTVGLVHAPALAHSMEIRTLPNRAKRNCQFALPTPQCDRPAKVFCPVIIVWFYDVAQAEAELVIPANGTADDDVGEPVTDKSISSALLPDSTCACPRTSQCLCERDPKECLRLCVR